MTDEPDWGLEPPRFKPEAALEQLKRSLRGLRLAERGSGFELRGKRVAELVTEDATIRARLARKPALTPEWDAQILKSAHDLRKWVDDVKTRLARWEREE
jgi:hypothetical protein